MSEPETGGGRTGRRTERRQEGIMWLSGLVSLVGAWIALTAGVTTLDLVVATYQFGPPTDAALWNDTVVGLAILLVSGYNFYRIRTGHDSSPAATGLVLLLGVWMVLFPLVVSVSGAALWNDVVAGAVVALGAGYNTYATRRRRRRLGAEV